ncbi:hypothetical protein O181_047133 [Austropuccinia psidii MF-1]|uniref:Uncharacterized protein n=1 Tax=Austropuccinia psidii MF-1 TaxID=1389203 RepID=A0A9Q3DVF8_9BASI|nr:hypothetical protein [Austropuccinia psidii MF-1]
MGLKLYKLYVVRNPELAKTPKDTLSPLKPPKTHFSLISSWHHPKRPLATFTINYQKCRKWCYTPLFIFFSPEIQWGQYQIVISAFHQVIKSHHPEDSSRLKEKYQSQIPIIPSSNHLLFSFTVFLQGNTGNSFSRDIQEAVPKQFSKCQCSINPPCQPHSFNTVFIHQDLYFQS